MSDLQTFLLLRIAERESLARDARDALNPRHVLAGCAAHRRLVLELDRMERHEAGWDGVEDKVMRYLALPYADHPDYQPEWRP